MLGKIFTALSISTFSSLVGFLPLVFYSRPNKILYPLIGWIFLLMLGNQLCLQLGHIAPLQWNWGGKIAAILWSLLFIRLCPHLSFTNTRLTFQQAPGSWMFSLIACSLLLILTIVGALNSEAQNFSGEMISFQLTMPGLEEEIFYRGILFTLCLLLCPKTFSIGKIQVPLLAFLMTALMFSAVHMFTINADFQLSIDLENGAYAFFFGGLMAWVAYRSGSILLPIIIHNLCNTVATLIMIFAP